ncbi:hypothetical protein DNTS_024268 [Danionella cerebrum]|uniref:Eukaryotic translation initiation factor 4 gamma 3 n=1 Tax=Danionella cerebrum TaxID=2873325 RepID=A0A553R3A9_9TELE|nr:hypothetical protein DNTS_024268 [Danionella translucida]
MSLPPKPAAVPVGGPGSGPSPSSHLRGALTPVPGTPVSQQQQPPLVPQTQIPRVPPPLDERIFSTQPVTAVYSVQRAPVPPYSGHEINKGHPSLAATPPGHASSPGLSQVSVSTVSAAHLYGHPKGWETAAGTALRRWQICQCQQTAVFAARGSGQTLSVARTHAAHAHSAGGILSERVCNVHIRPNAVSSFVSPLVPHRPLGDPVTQQSPYTPGQNAGTTPLVYSPQSQAMNAQPQSRPLLYGGARLCHAPLLVYMFVVIIHASGFFLFSLIVSFFHATPAFNQFSTGPRPTHHQGGFRPIQFFQRAQMQTARPAIPSNTPSIRPSSQTPTAAVYPTNQPIMMTMAPMPFHSPQTAQYYISQYRHSAPPYLGPPQQYPVQPAGPTAAPSYYSGQPMYSPSPSIIVPTPQQPPPAKREKKTIRIRDPNQGGKDVTDEILSGVGGSRNTTPPAGRPSSTPTPPQFLRPHPHYPHIFYLKSQQLNSQVTEHGHLMFNLESAQLLPAPIELKEDDKPKLEFSLQSSASPALRQPETSLERRELCSPVQTPPPLQNTELPPADVEMASSVATAQTSSIPSSTEESSDPMSQSAEDSPTKALTPEPEISEPVNPEPMSLCAPQPESAINGLMDADAALLSEDLEPQPREISPLLPTSTVPQLPRSEARPVTPAVEAESALVRVNSPLSLVEDGAGCFAGALSPSPSTDAAILTTPAPPPGLTHPSQVSAVSARKLSAGADLKEMVKESDALLEKRGESFYQSRKSSTQAIPKTWKKPKEDISIVQDQCPDKEENIDPSCLKAAAESPSPPPVDVERRASAGALLEENGQQELEPLRNGAEHSSETEGGDISLPLHKEPLIKVLPQLLVKNGKKQYDRDFLLGFQFMPACVQKPDGLPPISDVVLDKINQNKLPLRPVDPRMVSRGPDFTPAFADFSRPLLGGRGAPLLNIGLRRPPGRKIITNVSVNDEVQLKTVENAWKPGMKRESVVEDPEALKTQELFRKVRSILNKLTPQMFSQLMKQVTDLTIDTEERLKGVIDLVFEKAINEPSFSVAYGNMCSCLATDSERERLREELEEAKDKARRRSIGNIKFIGELFKLRMLTEAIMHDCVVKLLKNHDEESLECLCRLLTTIGKDLDFEKAKPRMDQYFNQMEKIVKERKTSSRIRFMLQDVIDLRLHHWVSRRADAGPKTIEQIHKEAKLEEQEEQRKVHQQLLSKDNKRRPAVQREETWNTVPMTKNSRTIDPTKIPKISKGSSLPTTSPDFDARRILSRRGSSGHERNDKPVSVGPARTGPTSLSSTNKESPEEFLQEVSRRDSNASDSTKLPTTTADKSRLEHGQSRESANKLESPCLDTPTLSEEEMERRSKAIIDEFLHINDYKEAVQCVEELEQPAMLYVFVRVGVESTLERSQIARDHLGQLLYQLLQAGILHKLQFFKGFSETLELADDMAIDIPHIWLYLAELVTPVLREGGISMRELFSEFSKPLLPVGRAGILFSEILHLLCKQMSHRKVGSLWRNSGLSWADLIPESEDVHSFITEHKLDFTLSDGSDLTETVSKRTLSPEELNKQIEKLLLEDMAGDEQIFDWVEANLDDSETSSPYFLRALMTAVCTAAVKTEGSLCKVDVSIIQKRLPVLHKYLNSDTERQLQALYALQALMVKLDQPANLLRMFFDTLYDEDVISEDAFCKWEASKDPAEQQGKGVALKSVTAFFTWLREAEEESEDN